MLHNKNNNNKANHSIIVIDRNSLKKKRSGSHPERITDHPNTKIYSD